MRVFKSVLLSAVFTFSVAAFARQNSTALTGKVPLRNFNSVRVEGVDIPPIPNAPFYAKVTLELTQTLPNGSSATHKTFNIIARDSHGRTRNEVRLWSPADASDPNLYYCTLYDQASRMRTYVFPSGQSGAQFAVDPAASTSSPSAPDSAPPFIQKVDLGTATQEGLTVQGTRETITYAPDESNSEQNVVVTKEYWYSPDLQIVVKSTTIDPRYGTEAVSVTGLDRAEPASALLEIPKNYHLYGERVSGNQLPIGGYAPPMRIRAGGNVMKNMLIEHPQPEYPVLVRQNSISGVVRFHVIIGSNGSVQQIEVISSHPLLVQAALDAVRLWRYRPFVLNGLPVEVDTTVDVTFQLH